MKKKLKIVEMIMLLLERIKNSLKNFNKTLINNKYSNNNMQMRLLKKIRIKIHQILINNFLSIKINILKNIINQKNQIKSENQLIKNYQTNKNNLLVLFLIKLNSNNSSSYNSQARDKINKKKQFLQNFKILINFIKIYIEILVKKKRISSQKKKWIIRFMQRKKKISKNNKKSSSSKVIYLNRIA